MVFATSYLVRNEYTEFTQPRQLFPLKTTIISIVVFILLIVLYLCVISAIKELSIVG